MHSRPAAAVLAVGLAATLTGAAMAQIAIGELQQRSGVEIAGAVTQVFGNKFVVEDGTGAVLVETGPRWHQVVDMTVGEEVRVQGEPNGDSFDAFVVIRANGEALRIRPEDGPPPWAGALRND